MKLIKQKDLKPWLKLLASQAKLLLAAKSGDTLLYAPYEEGLEPVLEGIPRLSAKGILFPQTQTLLKFNYAAEDKAEQLQTPLEAPETIVFGLRPCDAQGIAIIEQVFTQGRYQDPYFKARREHTTLIAVSCLEPPTGTCFCPTVGGSPVGSEGADLLLTRVGEDFLAEAITPKGDRLLEEDFFHPAGKELRDKVKQIKQEAKDKMADCPQLGDKEKLARQLEKIFLSDYWRQTAAACIGCNICTYLCPTCHCFNITDEMCACEGKRIRTWDGCLSCQYNLEASGHNPRRDKSQRYRNRINHKFSYLVSNCGIIGCVGCGRCIRNCPVCLDIREVVRKALEVE